MWWVRVYQMFYLFDELIQFSKGNKLPRKLAFSFRKRSFIRLLSFGYLMRFFYFYCLCSLSLNRVKIKNASVWQYCGCKRSGKKCIGMTIVNGMTMKVDSMTDFKNGMPPEASFPLSFRCGFEVLLCWAVASRDYKTANITLGIQNNNAESK